MIVLRSYLPPLSVLFLLALVFSLSLNTLGNSTRKHLESFDPTAPNAVSDSKFQFQLPKTVDYEERLKLVFDIPLFAETRRNPTKPKQQELNVTEDSTAGTTEAKKRSPTPKADPIPPTLEFLGYVRSENQIRALLSISTTSEEQWVLIGDRVLEWSVVEVSETIVRLQYGEFEHVVEKVR